MMAVDAETLTPIAPPSVGRVGAVGNGFGSFIGRGEPSLRSRPSDP